MWIDRIFIVFPQGDTSKPIIAGGVADCLDYLDGGIGAATQLHRHKRRAVAKRQAVDLMGGLHLGRTCQQRIWVVRSLGISLRSHPMRIYPYALKRLNHLFMIIMCCLLGVRLILKITNIEVR